MSKKAKIELREYSLVFTSHQYWARYNEAGQITGELHGVAMDMITKELGIGSSPQDKLKVLVYPAEGQPNFIDSDSQGFSGIYSSKQRAVIMFEGDEEESVAARWDIALKAASKLNERNIDYAITGSRSPIDFSNIGTENILTKLLESKDTDLNIGNDNSVARTLGDIMGFQPRNISGRAVLGQGKNLLPKEDYPDLYPEWPEFTGVREVEISGGRSPLDDPSLECITS